MGIKTPKSKAVKFEAVVQIPLLEEHIEGIMGWEIDDTELLSYVTTLTADGYEVAMSYSPERNQWSACLKGASELTGVNGGYWVYGNSQESGSFALKVVLYKHFFIANGAAWISVSTSQKSGKFS